MQHKIFAVYDEKAAAYLPPFFAHQTAMAERSFTAAAMQEGHNFNTWAHDYTLFELGTWDDDGAGFNLYEAKKPLGTAAEYRARQTGVNILNDELDQELADKRAEARRAELEQRHLAQLKADRGKVTVHNEPEKRSRWQTILDND